MCLAIPARLVEYLDDDRQYGKVEIGGVLRRVNTGLLIGADTAEPGEFVLIHVGFAMSKVSEEEAEETLRLLKTMEEIFDDEMIQIRDSEALADVGDADPAPLSAARA